MIPPHPTLTDRLWQGKTLAIIGAAVGLFLIFWTDGVAWHRFGKWRAAPLNVPAWRLRSAREWFQQARQHAADGDFQLALGTIHYALAWSPDDARLLNFEGNMHESLFQFREAQEVYERAVKADPANANAQQNLVLCQRINRIRQDPGSRSSTLYGLHRVMRDQGRLNEDLAISKRLGSDRVLWQVTWQAALDRTGIQGRIIVTDSGAMELDLTGARQPNLALIRDFPITSLNAGYTGLANIRDLRGLPLERLNLTQTVVEDLEPLHGMPLKVLKIAKTGVINLSPLAGCPLRELDISNTRIFDLAPLEGLPLTVLRATDTPINDLRHIGALPLTVLYLSRTKVSDLKPLSHSPLEVLALEGTSVLDLSPLKGSPLKELYLSSTPVHDLTPLKGMPLQVLTLSDCVQVSDLRPLAACTELEHLHVPPVPRYLESLGGLPRLRFVQRGETPFEERMLM